MAYVGQNVQLLCTCNNEMSPSSVLRKLCLKWLYVKVCLSCSDLPVGSEFGHIVSQNQSHYQCIGICYLSLMKVID